MNLSDAFDARSQASVLTIGCIEDVDAFRALSGEWRRLHEACPDSTPFNSWEWLFSWWQAYGHGKHLCVLTCRLEGQLVGIAPVYLALERSGVGTSAWVMRILGDGSADSDYLSFLIHPDLRIAATSALCDRLATDNRWDVLALRELPESSLLPQSFHRIAESRKLCFRVEQGRCGGVELPGTFAEFLRSCQPRFRTKLRGLLRKLEQGDLAFETHVGSLRRRLRSLFELHEARWRAAGTSGVFGQAAKRAFYAHFVPRFARRGWLRLYSLRFRDRYVAHQLCFGARGVTYLLQEGFDASEPSASYGQMLRAAVMRHLIENGETRYDFLGGFSRHKRDWGASSGKVVHLVIARRRWRGWLYFNLPLWRDQCAAVATRWLPAGAVRILKRAREAFS